MKLKFQNGAHFPWRPETRNKNSAGEKIAVKEEEIFKKCSYLCSHSKYCEKGFGREEDLGNSMDADHNFHSVDVDVKGGDRLI